MSNKYGQALGVWDLTVGRTKEDGPLQLHPTHKDNRKLLGLVMDEKIKTNQSLLLDRLSDFLTELISRNYPPENDNEKKELEEYIGSNILELMNETLIAFRLATREDLEETKNTLKKGMPQLGLGIAKP